MSVTSGEWCYGLATHFGVAVFDPLIVFCDGSKTVKKSIELSTFAHGRDMARWMAGEVADEVDDKCYD